MTTAQLIVAFLVLGFVGLSLGLQLLARQRAAQLTGQVLPPLEGATGARINAQEHALLYFFSPTCGACRPVTPRMKALADQGRPVFPIDATLEPGLAQALSVMATPTTVELKQGRVVKVYVGPVPAQVFTRFSAA